MAPTPITVLLADPRLPDATKPGGRFTPDDFDQVERLKAALGELTGYAFEYRDDHRSWLKDLAARPPSFALNLCDTGFGNDARLEAHVPALLEMLGVPYSGSGPAALTLCYDKASVRAVAQAHGVPVPAEVFVRAGEPLPELTYPAFLKPNRGDGSVGITARSIARDAGEARAYLDELRAALPGADVIAQEFLGGAEYGVGIIGNPGDGFDVLPALEVDYDALDPGLPRLLDYGSKTDPSSPYWSGVRFREARMDDDARRTVVGACERLFGRLGLRDYARFDFRADDHGGVKLMEVNPNPAWCHDGKLAHMAGLRGDSHAALLDAILTAALRRVRGARAGFARPTRA